MEISFHVIEMCFSWGHWGVVGKSYIQRKDQEGRENVGVSVVQAKFCNKRFQNSKSIDFFKDAAAVERR